MGIILNENWGYGRALGGDNHGVHVRKWISLYWYNDMLATTPHPETRSHLPTTRKHDLHPSLNLVNPPCQGQQRVCGALREFSNY